MNRRGLFGFLGGALIAPYAIKRLPVPVEPPIPVPQPDPGLSAKYSLSVDANGHITGLRFIGKPGPYGQSFILDMPKVRIEPEHPNCRCTLHLVK